ncbi:MAG TPA: class I SAM-dependent methyltransferase [Candidatus Pacearchaeota archaeon]|nr:class I SAM-dependent methyltransferase [Candidatus Pacearchaeota archaeon]
MNFSKNKLKFTGERVIVDNNSKYNLNYIRHMVAYNFAKDFIKGKIVLDDGSGSGYGSYFLAKNGAKKIIGIDISKEAVEYSKNTYKNKNLSFEVMNATNLNFNNNTFDVVCSFQVIEHIKDYDKFLSEIKRVLKLGGIALIVTPNKKTYSLENEKSVNPFHIKEFYLNEFNDILHSHFNDVEIFGVKYKPKLEEIKSSFEKSFYKKISRLFQKIHLSFIKKIIPRKIKNLVSKKYYKNINISDFEITKSDLDNALDFIGVCKKI